MKIEENIQLKDLNSFKVPASARYFVSVINENQVEELANSDIFSQNKWMVLGGGSNILFKNDWDGLIISMEIKGLRIVKSSTEDLVLEVGAGEDWPTFVETCVKNEYYGIENLAMIPGKVGSAPVQNIGAYGAEQSDFLLSVRGFDTGLGMFRELSHEECSFAYRSSVFKMRLARRFIVTSVKYRLSRKFKINLKYKELATEVRKFCVPDPDARYVYDTVCRLRRKKLPDPMQTGNAGSFFKNPVVTREVYNYLKFDYPDMPGYQTDDGIKLSAAWLIDKAGGKSMKQGGAAISPQHALVIINSGNATGPEIALLAEKVIALVNCKFGVKLEPEVRIIS